MSYEATALVMRGLGDNDLDELSLLSGSTNSISSEDAVVPETEATFQCQSDEDLILHCVLHREALSTLFRRHAASVLNVARRILKDDAEAEDLLQDVFLFIYQKAALFEPTKASAISWIIQMTYHRAIDRKRYLTTRKHYDVLEFEEAHQRTGGQQTSINELAGRELLSKFRETLSPEQRQTLELHFFEGYTFHEIAGRTGQTQGNVRHHYYRGIERLRSFVFPKKRD